MRLLLYLEELAQGVDYNLCVLLSNPCLQVRRDKGANRFQASFLRFVKKLNDFVQISRLQIHLAQVCVGVLIVFDLVKCVLREHFSLDFMRFISDRVQIDKTVEDLDTSFTVRALLHLLIQCPSIVTIHVYLLFRYIVTVSASASIHSN